ncbi:MAG: hypothetical protein PVF68_09565, partial [Acidobacteriota bacterium]
MTVRRIVRSFLVLAALLLPAATSVAGQEDERLAVLTYRLADDSRYVEGCLPPCRCSLLVGEDLRGTMRLVPEAADRRGVRYRIDDLLWVVTAPSTGELRISGTGSLTRSGGNLSGHLDLSLDGAEPVRYVADPAGAAGFPELGLTLRIPGATCYTDGFRIVAQPVSGNASVPYRLDLASRYVFGCLNGFCDCPVTARGLQGGFRALPLERYGDAQEVALVGFDAVIPSPAGVPGEPVHGVALYRFRGSGQEMFGTFAIGEESAAWFDSGWVDGAAPPELDITVT